MTHMTCVYRRDMTHMTCVYRRDMTHMTYHTSLYRNAHVVHYLSKKTNDTTWDLPLTGPESLEFPGWKPLKMPSENEVCSNKESV